MNKYQIAELLAILIGNLLIAFAIPAGMWLGRKIEQRRIRKIGERWGIK